MTAMTFRHVRTLVCWLFAFAVALAAREVAVAMTSATSDLATVSFPVALFAAYWWSPAGRDAARRTEEELDREREAELRRLDD